MVFYGSRRKKRNRKRMNRGIKILLIALLSCSIIIGTAIAIIPLIISQGQPDIEAEERLSFLELVESVNMNEEEPDAERRVPLGFAGEDRKELFFTFLILGLTEGLNANTIMVASYDAMNQEMNLVSIPRDSLVNADRNVRKINAAYPLGTLNGGGVEGGVVQMKREVASVIGFVPDFYIVIDYTAFERIIDVIGGVYIDVPFTMRYDDPCQNLHIHLLPGLQRMDGRSALHFARYRQSNFGYQDITDYQRIENQQTVIDAVFSKLLRAENLLRIPTFIEIFSENVHTNLSGWNLLWFADELNNIRGTDALSTYTVPTIGSSGPPMWYEILDGPGIVELVNRTINPFVQNVELQDLDIIDW